LKVLHFSKTPLAGAPIMLVSALRKHTNVDARLVDLDRWDIFGHDVIFNETPDLAISLAAEADVIHLHNYLDYDSVDFQPIDFNSLCKQGKIFIRHIHSQPGIIAYGTGKSIQAILEDPIPKLVIAQHPERYFPDAMVVPNFIPQDDPLYLPSSETPCWDIFFSPSNPAGAWTSRWDTKGMPETLAILNRFSKNTGARVLHCHRKPLAAVLREKQRSRIVIDELVTGSYHLSGLEGLSHAKPVLACLDSRVEELLGEFSGAVGNPFINVRLEESVAVLKYLFDHPDEAVSIGKESRSWIDTYWRDEQMVKHYEDIYQTVLQDPTLIKRQESLRIDNSLMKFKTVVSLDLVHDIRRRRRVLATPTGMVWIESLSRVFFKFIALVNKARDFWVTAKGTFCRGFRSVSAFLAKGGQ